MIEATKKRGSKKDECGDLNYVFLSFGFLKINGFKDIFEKKFFKK